MLPFITLNDIYGKKYTVNYENITTMYWHDTDKCTYVAFVTGEVIRFKEKMVDIIALAKATRK